MAGSWLTIPLVKKVQNSSDAWNFHFKKPDGFVYQAGQYIEMRLDIPNPDDRGISRYFTLSSSPTEDHLMVTTRILKSSFKLKLGSLDVEQEVKIKGPWGDFVLPEDNSKNLVFIAGGIGMTPFRSMIRYAADSGIKNNIKLLVSYKTPDQILYKEELEGIVKNNPQIKIIPTITQPEGTGWKGEMGRIDEKYIEKHIDNLGNSVYYVAGPDPMVEAMQKLLQGMGIRDGQILSDGFPGY
ncbi:MAG: FAD-dependent oxidoreductase [Candidatus Levyibacteriota bacterium]